jgi:hypothetical protein
LRDGGGVASTFTGIATTAGADALTVTMDSEDILELAAATIGQGAGVAAAIASTINIGGVGGDAIDLDPKVDTGSNVATIRFVGAASVTGGAGEKGRATSDGTGGIGGDGILAEYIDTLNFVGVNTAATAATAATVTIAAGSGGITGHSSGTTGAAGDSITVAANSKIVLTNEVDPFTSTAKAVGATNFVLNTVKGTNVEIDGSALTGSLSVTAADGNVIIKSGAGNDTITGGSGIDTISTGAGNDIINGSTGVDTITTGAGEDHLDFAAGDAGTGDFETITDYTAGVSGDVIDHAAGTTLLAAQTSTNVIAAIASSAGTDTLTASVVTGVVTLAGNAISKLSSATELKDLFELLDTNNSAQLGAIEMSGSTYLIADATSGNANIADIVGDIIKLQGLTGITAISTTAADNTITII